MRGMVSFAVWALFAALLSQQLFASVASIRFEDAKTYYLSPPSGKKPNIETFFYSLDVIRIFTNLLSLNSCRLTWNSSITHASFF